MDNMIIIPLNGSVIVSNTAVTGGDVSGAVFVAAGTTSLVASGGSGSGLTATITIGGTSTANMTASMTVTAGGLGYKIGDVVSFEDPLGGDFTGPVTFTLAAANLVGLGLASKNLVAPPHGQLMHVDPEAASDDVSAGYIKVHQIEPDHDRKWYIYLDGLTTANHTDVVLAINVKLRQCMQSPNSHSVMDNLPAGVSCAKLTLN